MIQPTEERASSSDPDASASPQLQSFYDQPVDLKDCDDFECGEIKVPMDYDDPGGKSITIAVKVRPADNTSKGALFINPGGPGGSGTEFITMGASMFGSDVKKNYDIVGFDPRGVGDSSAVRCYNDAQLDKLYSLSYDVDTDKGLHEFESDLHDYGQACKKNTGELINHLDTYSAARDLDILRSAFGQSKLTYLGFSYGTYLGAVYAKLFPAKVGRFVLDGAMDPSLNYDDVAQGQAKGFDIAYRSYIKDCLAGKDCPLSGDVDSAIDQTVQLINQLDDAPVPSGDPDRPVSGSDLISALTISLYSPQTWPVLTGALKALIRDNDGAQIKFLADYAMQREPDGTYPKSEGSTALINCSDFKVDADPDHMRAQEKKNEKISKVFGQSVSFGALTCAQMPVKPSHPREAIHAEGAPPVVVIGTTRDPATPYQWAEALADQLDDGVLVTYDGDGHTAYGRQSNCVNEAVDHYLVQGDLPQDGLKC